MTAPEPMDVEAILAEHNVRIQMLEQLVKQREQIIAAAVIETLRSEEIISEYLQRLTEKVEAEWSGQFLPELRQVMMRRLETIEEALGLNRDGGT